MRKTKQRGIMLILLALLVVGLGQTNVFGEDFAAYVKKSKDFKRVKQKDFKRVKQIEKILESPRWDHWILMPWRYRWGATYDSELIMWMKKHGHNGGFCDHLPKEDAKLQEKAGFLWYLDHAAGKGDLYQKVSKKERQNPERPVCLVKPSTVKRLKQKLKKSVTESMKYKTRIAYALDDEVSWSGFTNPCSFTNPCKWDNNPLSLADYSKWLKMRYGSEKALKTQWTQGALPVLTSIVNWGNFGKKDFIKRMANPDDLQNYYFLPLSKWNLSAWCDAISYMDSQFANLIGDLVDYSNSIDPTTPCGFVGGQAPAPYGGYDYAKIMRKIQFLEAYDIGASAEISRSLNLDNMMPITKTHFGDPISPETTWFFWYYLAHGDRGVIYWAQDWFKGSCPKFKIKLLGKKVKEIANVSKKIFKGKWKHNGIAIYYSHPFHGLLTVNFTKKPG